MWSSLWLCTVVVTSLAAPARVPSDDVAAALRELDALDPLRRQRAELWLGAHLAARDAAVVAAACRAASPGTRATLERLLGSENALFGLAALLAGEVDSAVAEIGRAGLVGQVARWSPALLAAPLPEGDVPPDIGQTARERERLALADYDADVLALRLDRGGFADLVERLDRLAGAPVPIVLDPLLYAAVRRGPGEPLRPARLGVGSWLELLEAERAAQRLALRVHGEAPYDLRRLEDNPASDAGTTAQASDAGPDTETEEALAFLREEVGEPRALSAAQVWIGLRGRAADSPLVERLVAWVTAVATEGGDPAVRAASARALASTRWPAAVLWLAEHWLATGDPAALEGCLAAVARGLCAPRLVQPGVVRALLAEVDRRLAAEALGSTPFAERVARALAALPLLELDSGQDQAPGEAHGGDGLTGDLLVDGFTELAPLAQWVRLVILEGRGRSHPRAAALVRDLLDPPGGGDVPAHLALQALAAWQVVSASDDAPPRVSQPAALLLAAVTAGLAPDAGRWLAAARARCAWTPAEVRALAQRLPSDSRTPGSGLPFALPPPFDAPPRSAGAPVLAAAEWAGLQHVIATVGGTEDVAAWRPVVARALDSAEGRATFAALARQAHETGRLFDGEPRHLVDFVRAALDVTTPIGADGPSPAALTFEAWVLSSGCGEDAEGDGAHEAVLAAVRRAQRLRDERLDPASLARLAGLVAHPRAGAEARGSLLRGLTLRIEALRAAEEASSAAARATRPGAADPPVMAQSPLDPDAGLELEDVVEALARAAEVLESARLDVESEALFGEIRSLAGRGWPALAAVLYDPGWPFDLRASEGASPPAGAAATAPRDGAVPRDAENLDARERLFGR